MKSTSALLCALILATPFPAIASESFSIKGISLGMTREAMLKKYGFKCTREAGSFGTNETCKVDGSFAGLPGELFIGLKSGLSYTVAMGIYATEQDFLRVVATASEKYGKPTVDKRHSDLQAGWYTETTTFAIKFDPSVKAIFINLVPGDSNPDDDF